MPNSRVASALRTHSQVLLSMAVLIAPTPASAELSHRPRPPSGSNCVLRERIVSDQLNDSFTEFDQTETGWRALDAHSCYRAAASLIQRYLAAHAVHLQPYQRATLYFHLAQEFANAGEMGSASSAIRQSQASSAQQPRRFPSWDTYVDGTLAYFRRDRGGLVKAIHGMEALSKAAQGASKTAVDLNLATLNGLLLCFTKSYVVAYSPTCARDRPHVSLPGVGAVNP